MKYTEMKQAIAAGTMAVGDEVWIVDYRHNDGVRIPIRALAPTRVKIFSNRDVARNHQFRYTKAEEMRTGYHFRELKKNGEPRAAVITPGVTHFYSPGVAVEVFLTEDEARVKYHEQVQVAIDQLREKQDTFNEQYNLKLLEMQGLLS
jgi:hypothetical protein